jgi:hypothetical protein
MQKELETKAEKELSAALAEKNSSTELTMGLRH